MAIGGMTIKEIQSRITYSEFNQWRAYRKKYGPMNDVRRYDRAAALIASTMVNLNGGKKEMVDYMPFGKDEREPELNDIVAAFKGGIKVGKRR